MKKIDWEDKLREKVVEIIGIEKHKDYTAYPYGKANAILDLFNKELSDLRREIEMLHGIGMTLDGEHFNDLVSRNKVLSLLDKKGGEVK